MSDKKKTAINQTGILKSLQKIEERSKEENRLSKEHIQATTSKEENPIFDSVNDVNGMKKMTNFESFDVQEIYGTLETQATKGRHSSISLLDSLVLTLYVLKNATSFSLVSHSFFGNLTHESMVRSAVNRVVPLLLKSLKAKWWEIRIRKQNKKKKNKTNKQTKKQNKTKQNKTKQKKKKKKKEIKKFMRPAFFLFLFLFILFRFFDFSIDKFDSDKISNRKTSVRKILKPNRFIKFGNTKYQTEKNSIPLFSVSIFFFSNRNRTDRFGLE